MFGHELNKNLIVVNILVYGQDTKLTEFPSFSDGKESMLKTNRKSQLQINFTKNSHELFSISEDWK
jgi:hypothetical protein